MGPICQIWSFPENLKTPHSVFLPPLSLPAEAEVTQADFHFTTNPSNSSPVPVLWVSVNYVTLRLFFF